MTCPGGWLRAMCTRLCSARTMDRLIDPVLADLQTEYSEALRRRQTWRSRWVLLAGYVAFLKVITVCGCERLMRTLREGTADDRQALARTIALSAAAMLAMTVLILFWPMLHLSRRTNEIVLFVYLIPQALPLTVPVGFTLGLFCALGGRVVSPRLAALVLATALACCVISFTTMAWMIPAAGEGFRESVARHVRMTKGAQVSQTKGATELTLGELRQQIDSYTLTGRSRYVRTLRLVYHRRWALPCATFALALFALSVMPRRPVGRWILGFAACGICFAYWVLLAIGQTVAQEGTLPAVAGAWLANVVFAVTAAALMMAGSCRSGAISRA